MSHKQNDQVKIGLFLFSLVFFVIGLTTNWTAALLSLAFWIFGATFYILEKKWREKYTKKGYWFCS